MLLVRVQVKVHFIGWKPRFDEWMHRDSEKIRVLEDKEYTLDVAETRPPVDSKRCVMRLFSSAF